MRYPPAPIALVLDVLYAMGAVPGHGRSLPAPRLRAIMELALDRPVSAQSVRGWCCALQRRGRVDSDLTRAGVDPLRYTRVGARCAGYWYILAPGEAPPTRGL